MKTAKELFLEMLMGINMSEVVDVEVLQATVSKLLERILSENPKFYLTYYRNYINILPPDNPGRIKHRRDNVEICIEWTEKTSIGVESHRLTKVGNRKVFYWDGLNTKRVVVNETAGILF
jgi:hypothetical protein